MDGACRVQGEVLPVIPCDVCHHRDLSLCEPQQVPVPDDIIRVVLMVIEGEISPHIMEEGGMLEWYPEMGRPETPRAEAMVAGFAQGYQVRQLVTATKAPGES